MQIVQFLCGLRTVAAVATASLLVACGMSGNKSGAAVPSQPTGRDTKAAHRGADSIDPDMVAAVSSAHSTTPTFRCSVRAPMMSCG